MFVDTVYKNRRNQLKHLLGSGLIWLPGNSDVGINYSGNTYDFRQDSTFLYFVGHAKPDLHILIDIDNDIEYLVGNEPSIDDTIWMGHQTSMSELAENSGVKQSISPEKMASIIKNNLDRLHTLPQYRYKNRALSEDLGHPANNVSMKLITSVIYLRSRKEDREVREIENSLQVTRDMHHKAMLMANEGATEHEITAASYEIAKKHNCSMAYLPIISIHGEILHNHHHENTLKKGDILLCDMGVSNSMGYASDITRSTPVNRTFDARQKAIYNIVLKAQQDSISAVKPDVSYKDIHLNASKIIFDGLKELGLTKGDTEEAVKEGAHALFFPHGLGHMMGLDVHDLEALGENHVGYNDEITRSDQFGLAYLRLGKNLVPGNVLTVEPGIYFIEALFNMWREEKKMASFINYDETAKWMGFGGIRLEDNVLVTNNGHRVLGEKIAITVDEIESGQF